MTTNMADNVKALLKNHPNLIIKENEDGKCKVFRFNISDLISNFMFMSSHIVRHIKIAMY